MKQKTFTYIYSFCFLLLPMASVAQKIYVYCPSPLELQVNTEKLAGIKINLMINDLRHITDDDKIECNSDAIKQTLATAIINAFPSAIINYVTEKPKQVKGQNTVTINITAYHSASGIAASTAIGGSGNDFAWGVLPSNRWNSVTGFNVVIESHGDDSNIKKQSRNIANVVSRPNIGGGLTSKKALNEAYVEARRELLFFLGNSIIKN